MTVSSSKTEWIGIFLLAFSFIALFQQPIVAQDGATLRVSLQRRMASTEKDLAAGTFVIHQEIQHWNPKETAIIICDMWNRHWCQGATSRVAEMAPRMNEVLTIARDQGITIVHAPSDTLKSYEDHPARKRAQQFRVPGIETRLGRGNLASEAGAEWPIDQSDEGCDCTPTCPVGPPWPWTHQIETLTINADSDLISDSGVEIGSYFEEKGIKNVILMGVHTNMCVIGRSFGLRNMARLGMNVVLMRDLTDTMYNSKSAPYVSHFTGNSLIQEYIETYVCPSMVSTDFTGQKQFRFKDDPRPLVTFVTAENEYRTNQRFHEFAHELLLAKNVNCDFAVGEPVANSHNIENLQILKDADLVFLSVRRRALEEAKMNAVRDYVASGKALVGIRTASHAFSLRGAMPPEGLVTWEDFDKEVWGGNYTNHYGNSKNAVRLMPGMESHPLLRGVDPDGFTSVGSLYQCQPLAPGTQVLLIGTFFGFPQEPVLWINHRPTGDVVYTSLGHQDDWDNPNFKQLMLNTVDMIVPPSGLQ